MHQRDVLMATAFDHIGSLPMATIDKFREMKQREVGLGTCVLCCWAA